MIYDKIIFTYGSPVEYGYRIMDNGQFVKFTDLDGNELSLGPCGYSCVDPNPLPSWAV